MVCGRCRLPISVNPLVPRKVTSVPSPLRGSRAQALAGSQALNTQRHPQDPRNPLSSMQVWNMKLCILTIWSQLGFYWALLRRSAQRSWRRGWRDRVSQTKNLVQDAAAGEVQTPPPPKDTEHQRNQGPSSTVPSTLLLRSWGHSTYQARLFTEQPI